MLMIEEFNLCLEYNHHQKIKYYSGRQAKKLPNAHKLGIQDTWGLLLLTEREKSLQDWISLKAKGTKYQWIEAQEGGQFHYLLWSLNAEFESVTIFYPKPTK